MTRPNLFKTYYWLAKPGIVYGNALTAGGGFLLASKGQIDIGLLLATIIGISLVIGSSCVFNNYIDRHIDEKMDRTKWRAFASGQVRVSSALSYGAVLGAVGFSILLFYTNVLTVMVGVIGVLFYLGLYGFWKRRSPFGTVVGSVSGAIPPVGGYVAVSNQLDLGAVLLFLVLTFWQMPHFYAIALYRQKDYARAGLPVLPVKKGVYRTKVYILLYVVAFTLAVTAMTVFGFTGYTYLLVMVLLSMLWFWKGVQGFQAPDSAQWGRRMFLFSLIVLTTFSALLAVDVLLP